jgi:hypothetical protein
MCVHTCGTVSLFELLIRTYIYICIYIHTYRMVVTVGQVPSEKYIYIYIYYIYTYIHTYTQSGGDSGSSSIKEFAKDDWSLEDKDDKKGLFAALLALVKV